MHCNLIIPCLFEALTAEIFVFGLIFKVKFNCQRVFSQILKNRFKRCRFVFTIHDRADEFIFHSGSIIRTLEETDIAVDDASPGSKRHRKNV